MSEVEVTFDCQFQTWNVMLDGKCIEWGNIFDVENWLVDNKDKYFEVVR